MSNLMGFESTTFLRRRPISWNEKFGIPLEEAPTTSWQFAGIPRYFCEKSRRYFARKVGLAADAPDQEIIAAFQQQRLQLLLEWEDLPISVASIVNGSTFRMGILVRNISRTERVRRRCYTHEIGIWRDDPIWCEESCGALVFQKYIDSRHYENATMASFNFKGNASPIPLDALRWLRRGEALPKEARLERLDEWSVDAVGLFFGPNEP